jgi:hypothetical protein
MVLRLPMPLCSVETVSVLCYNRAERNQQYEFMHILQSLDGSLDAH